jgi:hypothetical protein
MPRGGVAHLQSVSHVCCSAAVSDAIVLRNGCSYVLQAVELKW